MQGTPVRNPSCTVWCSTSVPALSMVPSESGIRYGRSLRASAAARKGSSTTGRGTAAFTPCFHPEVAGRGALAASRTMHGSRRVGSSHSRDCQSTRNW